MKKQKPRRMKDQKPRYYMIDWKYRGAFSNCAEGRQANIDCCDAEQECHAIMELAGLCYKHAYAYPDGSMYKYVAVYSSEKPPLQQRIQEAMDRIDLKLIYGFKISDVNGKGDPYKCGCKTVEEYFNLP